MAFSLLRRHGAGLGDLDRNRNRSGLLEGDGQRELLADLQAALEVHQHDVRATGLHRQRAARRDAQRTRLAHARDIAFLAGFVSHGVARNRGL
jgi:hypothetical protein